MISGNLKREQIDHEAMPSLGSAEAYDSLGVALGEKGDLRASVGMFQQALDIRPDYARAWNNLGVALKGLGEAVPAIQHFRRAIHLDPDYVEAHWNLSFLLLLTGAYEEGWREYEWRFRKKEWGPNLRGVNGLPRWDGAPFRGKRLLVYGEQGFGDALQFVRYLCMVKALGGTVILQTQQPLLSLFRSVPGVDDLIEQGPDMEAEGAFDFHIPLLSLPRIFKTTVETIPSEGIVPYIHADPEKAAYWRRHLPENRFNIGLVWQGKATDPKRACPLERLAPLAGIEGVRIYSLQKGEAASQVQGLPKGVTITNLGDGLMDFSDTAAVIENLDLVVSVDTAVLHLAGAMGKPAFALLPFAADWRWLLHREDSPWYPAMRLFRQHAPGNWDDPLKRLISEVRDLTGEPSGTGSLTLKPGRDQALPGGGNQAVDIKQMVSEAIRLHQSGQLQASVKICEQVLQGSPGNWEALHLLCIICHQTGQAERITALTSEVSRCRDRTHELFLSLGNLLKDLGRREQALRYYQEGLRVRPDFPELHYNMGNLLTDEGRFKDAILCYSKAIEYQSDLFDAYYNMGNCFSRSGELHKALSCYRKTLNLKPDHIEAGHNAGLALKDLGRFDEAVRCYQETLKFKPDAPELHYNLGNVYKEEGKFKDAVSCYEKAIRLDPAMVEAHYNMANALKESGALDPAISCYERVLSMAPDHFGAMNNVALAYRDAGHIDRAVEMFDQALKVRPDHVEIRWNRSLALLLRGDLAEGWKEYEVRFQRNDLRTTYPRRFDKPLWDGSPFDGKTLLVHHEQGLGDTLQFIRYLPMVKARGGRVVLEVHASLLPLCRELPGVDEVVARPMDQDLDVSFDCYIPLLSLPGMFHTTIESIPADVPYIHADPEIERYWHNILDRVEMTIGLVWAGNPGHKDDRNRSCPLHLLAPLSRIPGIRLYGIQKHGWEGSEPLLQGMGIANLGKDLKDFSVTAGIIAHLDLIISVDTAVAHLAGAMGKPVFILLPFVPDWRWLMEREDTPWYPTARLYRQKKRGGWEEVIARIADDIRAMVGLRGGDPSRQGQVGPGHGAAFSERTVASALMTEAFQAYQAGDSQKAEEICDKLLTGEPDHAEALHLKGLACHRSKQYGKAVEAISRAVEIDPNEPVFLNNLGAAYQEKGDLKHAAACYQRAVQLKPDFVEACQNLGKAFLEGRQFENSFIWFEKAAHLRPDDRTIYPKLSEVLLELGRPDEAVACGKRLLDLSPESADAHFIIGNGLKEQDQLERAISSYQTALNLHPGHIQSLVHMGLAFQSLGKIEAAAKAFERAIAMDSSHTGANVNRALIDLLTGNYAEGWRGYEWRLRMDEWKTRHPHRPERPRWDGSSIPNGTVLVYHEQGLGDALQFVRFLPMVKVRSENVIFETDRRLLRLFKGLARTEDLIMMPIGGCSEMTAIAEIPLMSLPGLFGTTLETIPSEIPYLEPEPDLVSLWARRLSVLRGFRVGISWQGNPSYRNDRRRSAPLKHFSDLARIDGVTLVSLQKGYGLDQMGHLPNDVSIINLGPELDGGADAFVDTAAVMANLDLIITSDTAIPHLAGAMGAPVWLVLPHIPDWRWGLSGETCPWYPSMRLFRQERRNDWPGVFHRVSMAIRERIGGRGA